MEMMVLTQVKGTSARENRVGGRGIEVIDPRRRKNNTKLLN